MRTRPSVPAALALVAASAGAAAPSAELTLSARPDVVQPFDYVVFSGRIEPARAGESVVVETRECGFGDAPYRVFAGAQTVEGGAWSVRQWVPAPGSFRARWGNAYSAPVRVRMRADVRLTHEAPTRRFVVGVGARYQNMHGRTIELQRRSASGAWVRVGRARLSRVGYGFFHARFVVRRRGLTLRGWLPGAAAAPCYLAAASPMLRS